MPSASYSCCSCAKMNLIKCCCSCSFARLMQNCSNELTCPATGRYDAALEGSGSVRRSLAGSTAQLAVRESFQSRKCRARRSCRAQRCCSQTHAASKEHTYDQHRPARHQAMLGTLAAPPTSWWQRSWARQPPSGCSSPPQSSGRGGRTGSWPARRAFRSPARTARRRTARGWSAPCPMISRGRSGPVPHLVQVERLVNLLATHGGLVVRQRPDDARLRQLEALGQPRHHWRRRDPSARPPPRQRARS